jgi:hypothetical protein
VTRHPLPKSAIQIKGDPSKEPIVRMLAHTHRGYSLAAAKAKRDSPQAGCSRK